MGTSNLHQLESIWEHPDQGYMALFTISMFFVISILFFEYLILCCDRFREPKIDLHALYKI